MRKGLLSFALLIFSQVCTCQVKENNPPPDGKKEFTSSYFSEFVIGMAIPTGNFAGTDPQDSHSGFARTGGFLFAGYGKLYNDRVGFEVAVAVAAYPFDEEIDQQKKIENAYYERGFGWWTISGLIGPYFSLPVKKFSFDFRVLAGIMDVIRPTFRNINSNGTAKLEESAGNGYAFSWQFGAGIQYRVSEKFGLKLSIDYVGAIPDIHYQETASYYHVYYYKSEIKYKQPVSSIISGLGLILHLD